MALKRAQDLLDDLFISKPEDIDLVAIAQSQGATVEERPLSGTEARIVGSGDEAIITVNSTSRPERRRFSIGHELGHWMHDRGKMNMSCTTDKQDQFYTGQGPEPLANAFAAELLLPASMLLPRLAGKQPVLETVQGLAGTFRSSMTSTACRIVEMRTHPLMVVCSTKTNRRWYKAATELAELAKPLKYLGKDTLAFKLFNEAGYQGQVEEVDADAWIDHPDAADYEIVESSFRVTDDLVVSVLWWKDESQLRDLLRATEDEDE